MKDHKTQMFYSESRCRASNDVDAVVSVVAGLRENQKNHPHSPEFTNASLILRQSLPTL